MSNYGCKEKKKSPETLEMIITNKNDNDRKEVDKKLIINFSMVNYIDEFGIKCLEKIIIDYKKESIRVCLTNCNGKFKYYNLHILILSGVASENFTLKTPKYS